MTKAQMKTLVDAAFVELRKPGNTEIVCGETIGTYIKENIFSYKGGVAETITQFSFVAPECVAVVPEIVREILEMAEETNPAKAGALVFSLNFVFNLGLEAHIVKQEKT